MSRNVTSQTRTVPRCSPGPRPYSGRSPGLPCVLYYSVYGRYRAHDRPLPGGSPAASGVIPH
eukprot:764096-Hanusia_phi.AAC.6